MTVSKETKAAGEERRAAALELALRMNPAPADAMKVVRDAAEIEKYLKGETP